MFQKFNTDTLGGRFIKSLLAQTPIPIFECVLDGDHLVEGCYYIYKQFVIRCASSGVLAVNKTEKLYPSDKLFPSVFLIPDKGLKCATFYVKSMIDEYNMKIFSTYKSSSNFYDSETHYQLGRYLRYVYVTTGLNLFPFYNCYNATYFSDVELFATSYRGVGIRRTSKQKSKVVAVPILFGHTYTIALDCPTQVLVRACLHDNSGFSSEEDLPKDVASALSNSGTIYSRMQFKNLNTFRIETASKDAIMLQHNLYLMIQLPYDNDSSIVVLENFDDFVGVKCNENYVREPFLLNSSLLKMNTRESYAFSDRLIEYLLGNVVYERDNISQNIAKVQTAIATTSYDYYKSFIRGINKKGIWDNNIKRIVLSIAEEYNESNVIYDQDGNINKDTEKIIYRKGGNY